MEETTKTRKKPEKKNILLTLFSATLYLSTFTFGGGYVIITLLKNKFVDYYHWIDEEEMLDLVAIAQSSPGAIAVNGAIVVGYKLCGLPGVLVSVAGAVIPPMVILSLVSMFYEAFQGNPYIAALLGGMTAGVGAVIASAAYDMSCAVVRSKDWVHIAIMLICFLTSYFLHVNIVLIIALTALFGLIRTFIEGRKGKA
ncbi:chromate transporter [Luxibacter massiliensis]|uniref:chromate transporter n=1 Tax=Luxibacter massiliensis TaxID=2219695 RepID=UPI000F052592|nr:chromate transporter [Luxibacter massiliensis]